MKLNNLSKISSNILLSRITGMFRDVLFANFLGASALSDAFMFAFRLPNLFRRILAEGAINSVFIPLYLDHKAKSKSETEIFFSNRVSYLTSRTRLHEGLLIIRK